MGLTAHLAAVLSLRAHVWICVGLSLLVFGGAILGNILAETGVIPPSGVKPAFRIGFVVLFFVFGFSCIPVMAKLVLGSHRKDGEAAKGLAVAETIVTWGLWALIAAGLAIGLPFAIRDGFLSDAPAAAPSSGAAPDPFPGSRPRP